MCFHFCLFSCRLRILDSFGTDPEFNYAEYKDAAKFKSGWGKADVHVRQMMTMFRKYMTDLSWLSLQSDNVMYELIRW